MEEMRKILVANNLKLPTKRVSESSSEVREVRQDALPWGDSKRKKGMYRVMTR